VGLERDDLSFLEDPRRETAIDADVGPDIVEDIVRFQFGQHVLYHRLFLEQRLCPPVLRDAVDVELRGHPPDSDRLWAGEVDDGPPVGPASSRPETGRGEHPVDRRRAEGRSEPLENVGGGLSHER